MFFFCFWKRKAGCKSSKLKIFLNRWTCRLWKPRFWKMDVELLASTNLVPFNRILIFSWFPFQMTPSHIEVRRCDGSCHHRKQSCLAVRTQKKRVPVSNHENWIQAFAFEIRVHEKYPWIKSYFTSLMAKFILKGAPILNILGANKLPYLLTLVRGNFWKWAVGINYLKQC